MSHTFEDIPYRQADGETLLGRLYRPDAPAQALVVEVHGGAWTQNDRTTNASTHQHLADRGVAVFAIDFRMAPKHRYPVAVQDVNYAVRWVKANAAKLGLAPRLVGLLGTSSGGHLATLAAILPDDPRFKTAEASLGDASAKVDFLVDCWPIADPLARYHMARARGLQNLVNNHHAFWPDEAAMAEGNPHLIVEAGKAAHLPALQVLQGTADENVEHERTDAFVDEWRKHGGEVEYHKFPGEPHTFVTKNPAAPATLDALKKIGDFVVARIAK